jgi:hypothetical protein
LQRQRKHGAGLPRQGARQARGGASAVRQPHASRVVRCGSAAVRQATERLKMHMHSSSLKSSTGMHCVTEQVQRTAQQLDLPQASRGTAAEHEARRRRLQEGAACCLLAGARGAIKVRPGRGRWAQPKRRGRRYLTKTFNVCAQYRTLIFSVLVCSTNHSSNCFFNN